MSLIRTRLFGCGFSFPLPQSTSLPNFPNSNTWVSYNKKRQLKLSRWHWRTQVKDNNVNQGSSETHDHPGSQPNHQTHHTGTSTSTELLQRLKRYGISGILSYGLLNTVYYLTTFLFVWFYVVPAPGKLGYAAAIERFLKLLAMVWVGSQVTKLARAAGALALAPLVSRGLTWATVKLKFESETKAFMVIVGACFGIAVLLFSVVTLLCA